jgi:hypothetical protein
MLRLQAHMVRSFDKIRAGWARHYRLWTLYNARRRKRDLGFTILELLISISLLVVIVVIAAGAMRLGSKAVVAGEKRSEALERYRMSLFILNAQIQSYVPLTFNEGGVKTYYFKGEKKSLTLGTNYSIWTGTRGYTIVTYHVVMDGSGGQSLHASERVAGAEGARDVKLFDLLREINFDYFFKAVGDAEGKWVEQWTDEAAMPEKIRVNLFWGAKSASIIVPIRVKALPLTAPQS